MVIQALMVRRISSAKIINLDSQFSCINFSCEEMQRNHKLYIRTLFRKKFNHEVMQVSSYQQLNAHRAHIIPHTNTQTGYTSTSSLDLDWICELWFFLLMRCTSCCCCCDSAIVSKEYLLLVLQSYSKERKRCWCVCVCVYFCCSSGCVCTKYRLFTIFRLRMLLEWRW